MNREKMIINSSICLSCLPPHRVGGLAVVFGFIGLLGSSLTLHCHISNSQPRRPSVAAENITPTPLCDLCVLCGEKKHL
jgi:hypothetical protein